MKKLAMTFGAAAVAVICGCKDPDYRRGGASSSQNEVKRADTVAAEAKPVEVKQCTCAPGARHSAPCACGGANCMCVVEQKSVIKPQAPAPVKPQATVEPEYTIYVVRSGDYLAKISSRFNVTIAAIKRINSLSSDVVRIGQKLKIPGKVDVGEAPVAAKEKKPAKAAATQKAVKAYTGATKEYVVKSGDTLGAIALGCGLSVRQLKNLNSLSSDVLRIGQKLKVPAEKVVKAKAASKAKVEKPAVVKEEKKAETAVVEEKKVETPAAGQNNTEAPVVEEKKAEPEEPKDVVVTEPEAPATSMYEVQDGDDITGIAIRFAVSASEIRALNNLSETDDQLKPGQKIKLPIPADAQQ